MLVCVLPGPVGKSGALIALSATAIIDEPGTPPLPRPIMTARISRKLRFSPVAILRKSDALLSAVAASTFPIVAWTRSGYRGPAEVAAEHRGACVNGAAHRSPFESEPPDFFCQRWTAA